MTKEQQSRTQMLIGEEGLLRLARAHVAVFGLGGVGGYAVEALVRAGVGTLTLCDPDTVSESNRNRQILALTSTVGASKVEVAAARAREINPDVTLELYPIPFLPESADSFDFSRYDYVVDAIDTVSGKLELIRRARAAGVPILCAMGTGNRLTARGFTVAELEKTTGCPLARSVRTLCRHEGIQGVRVLYSPVPSLRVTLPEEHGRHAPGSISYVPAIAGLMMAEEVVRHLLQQE